MVATLQCLLGCGEIIGVTTFREALGTRSHRATWCRTILASAVGAVGVVVLAPLPARAAAAPSVAVPAYFWSSTEWDRMLVSSEELRYVVMNPDSGPGTASHPTFVNKVAAARSQDATVVGYVDTAYGVRSLATVKADIDKYRAWYGVNAFFFDQTPYDCAQISYYQDLEDYVRAQVGGFTFLNPGMNPHECYLGVADVVVNFEGSEASYNAWTPAPYVAGYPADRFWHIVYSVDPSHAAALLSRAASRNGGLVFLTEKGMPNPFSVIPTDALWSAQTPTRSGRNAAPQAPPPSATAAVATATRIAAPQSPSPISSSPPGAAAEAPVTTRLSVGAAGPAPSTTTIATGSAQSAPVPLTVEPVASSPAPSSAPVSNTVAPTGRFERSSFLSQSAPVPTVQRAPIASDAFPTGPPANGSENSMVEPGAAAGPFPGSGVTAVWTSPSPTTTRLPAGPALAPTTLTLPRGAVRVAATRATPARRQAEVQKKAPVPRRRSIR